MFLASNVTQVAVISGWNSFYSSMGLVGHFKHLALVVGAMPGAQWVPNGDWSGSFLAPKSSFLRGVQWHRLACIATQVAEISGCSQLSGSIGPRAHTKYLIQVVGAIVHARWVRNGLWRGSFFVKNSHI